MKFNWLFLALFLSSLIECQAQNEKAQSADQPKVSVKEIFKRLPGKNGERYSSAMKHGEVEIFLYAPIEIDDQTPHDKDELYVIISGSGIFFDGKDRFPFMEGDVIFVPAKVEHRFEKFTDDFKTWVIFYGDSKKK